MELHRQGGTAGDIGKKEDAEIAKAVCWERDPQELIEALVAAQWVYRDDRHRLVIADWPIHASDLIRKWLKRHRQEFVEARVLGNSESQNCGNSESPDTPASRRYSDGIWWARGVWPHR